MHATPPITRYFAPDRLSAAHTCAAMTRAASLPGEARLLPFVEILIGVEADHLLPPAPPRPDLAGETGQLLGSLEPLRRRAVERSRPPIGGRQHVAGQGDGNSGQGHDTHTQYYWIRSIYHFRWS